jgi:cell division topological specificity factor
MNFLKFFRVRSEAPPTAAQARERLQVVLAHERAYASAPDFIPKLQNEILQVIARYVDFDQDKLSINLEHKGTVSRLEVDIELPNSEPVKAALTTVATSGTTVADAAPAPVLAVDPAGGTRPAAKAKPRTRRPRRKAESAERADDPSPEPLARAAS